MANEAGRKSGEEVVTSDESLGRSRAAADRRVHSEKDSNDRAPLQVDRSQLKPLLEKPVPNAEHQPLGRRTRKNVGKDKSPNVTKRPKIIPVATSSGATTKNTGGSGRTNCCAMHMCVCLRDPRVLDNGLDAVRRDAPFLYFLRAYC